jgi:hypothetical protein
MDMSGRRFATIRDAEATPGECDQGAMTRITSIRALGNQFRVRALTVKDPALALELQELADICERKAASLDRRAASDAE